MSEKLPIATLGECETTNPCPDCNCMSPEELARLRERKRIIEMLRSKASEYVKESADVRRGMRLAAKLIEKEPKGI